MIAYGAILGTLIAVNAALYYCERIRQAAVVSEAGVGILEEKPDADENVSVVLSNFRNRFFGVYVLVVASDWLQGPYIYSVYKSTLGLPEETVAALFVTGFLGAAIGSTFVGNIADRYGRRLACLSFCGLYAVSCLTMLSSEIHVLFCGRVLGGVSTTLLFSTFETWMVAEFHRLDLDKVDGSLSDIFSTMSTLNGATAVLSGIISEALVRTTGSQRAPFMASIACLFVASLCILNYWNENYGQQRSDDTLLRSGFKGAIQEVKDLRILTLMSTSCCFEGSMYVMVYLWSPAIIAAQDATGIKTAVPFGIIFADFMSAMMLGSMIFARACRRAVDPDAVASYSVKLVLSIAPMTLLATLMLGSALSRVIAFTLFEVCVGVYFPAMGCLKGRVIADNHRGRIYGLMRLPLNLFVVSSLGSMKEGEPHREDLFMICSALLLVAMIMMHRVF